MRCTYHFNIGSEKILWITHLCASKYALLNLCIAIESKLFLLYGTLRRQYGSGLYINNFMSIKVMLKHGYPFPHSVGTIYCLFNWCRRFQMHFSINNSTKLIMNTHIINSKIKQKKKQDSLKIQPQILLYVFITQP